MSRALLLGLLPLCSGCLAFAYPAATATPSVSAPEPEVRAFKRSETRGGTSIILTGGESMGGSLEEIPLKNGQLDALSDVYLAYFAGSPFFTVSDVRSWSVLFYRPGYEVIEMPSRWWAAKLFAPHLASLPWRRAETIDEEIAALETLAPERSFVQPSAPVRRFLGREYERLASRDDVPGEKRRVAEERARRYREPQ